MRVHVRLYPSLCKCVVYSSSLPSPSLLQTPGVDRSGADRHWPSPGGGARAVHAVPGVVLLLCGSVQGPAITGPDQEALEDGGREG